MTAPPLRIIHLFRAPVGGLFRHVADLLGEQSRAGHAVGIVCDSSTGGEFEARALAALADRLALGLIRLPMRRQIGPADLLASQRVLARLRIIAPDVIHGHGAKGGAYARPIATWLGRRRPIARIYTPHGGSLHYDPKSLRGRIYFAAERLLERMTDAIIHVSAFEAETYRAKVQPPRCRMQVIFNGLRAEEFEPVTARPGACDFLFLGEFRPLKGVDVLLEAIARLARESVRPSANFVGPQEGRDAYRALAARLGISELVAFNGPMPARDAFATARAIVVPSRAESLPYVVLEAIAAGVPIIATRVGGIPEIFGPHADKLIPAGDAGALSAALKAFLADPARARADAQACRAWLQPRFDIKTMQHEVCALYREVLARKPPPKD